MPYEYITKLAKNLYKIHIIMYNVDYMFKRNQTKLIRNKSLSFGGTEDVLIQSMCTFKTSNTNEIIKQINLCAKHGANLMRVSILDKEDANAIKVIKSKIKIPLVADIHYDYNLALLAMDSGVDKIRINPGNLNNKNEIIKIIEKAKEKDVIIRIGVNLGSIETNTNEEETHLLVEKALEYIKFFEENSFYKIIVSLKSSDPIITKQANELFASLSNYPLHIGVTESGYDEIGIIRSVAGLSPLLINGIGNTIRISLTKNPLKEIETCKRLLHDLNLYINYPTIISCPTCGRCKVQNTKEIAKKVFNFCIKNKKYIKVAIMGCIVNGIGEGKNADIGIAGANGKFIIFKKGQQIKVVDQENVLDEFYKIILEF